MTWLVEEGIGEHRALLVEGDSAIAARLEWPGKLAAGQVDEAKLVKFDRQARRGVGLFASGEEALVDRLPADSSEGAPIRLEITRAALTERGRLKRAQARPSDAAPRPSTSLADALDARIVRRFPAGLWEDVWADAWRGEIAFPTGSLLFAPTPAMTVIDIDGVVPPAQLARDAVTPLAAALRRHGLVASRKEGTTVYYRVRDSRTAKLLALAGPISTSVLSGDSKLFTTVKVPPEGRVA